MRISCLVVLATALSLLAASPLLAQAPATRPSLPPLTIGAKSPKSFIVDGILRFGEGTFGFRVAVDGPKQLVAVFDARDGTPLFISDGQRTLIYDLEHSQIVLTSNSRAYVAFDWVDKDKDQKPMKFMFGVGFKEQVEQLVQDNSYFRIDRILLSNAYILSHAASAPGTDCFTATREDGSKAATFLVYRNDPTRFHFSRTEGDLMHLALDASQIDQPIADAALAFPDAKLMAKELDLIELNPNVDRFFTALRNGRAFMAKMALVIGPDIQTKAASVIIGVDWKEVAARDVTFGASYRAALAKQGFSFPVKSAPASAPTTAQTPTR